MKAIEHDEESTHREDCFEVISNRMINQKMVHGKPQKIYKFSFGSSDSKEKVITVDSVTYHDIVEKSTYYCPLDSTFN